MEATGQHFAVESAEEFGHGALSEQVQDTDHDSEVEHSSGLVG